MAPELVIYRGLPASGKTTLAKAWVAEDPGDRARVNRDDLRAMLHDGVYLGHDTEKRVRVARDRMIRGLLDQGVSVACDDTNLRQSVARDLAKLARFSGATVRVVDLTLVPLEVCIQRDRLRVCGGSPDGTQEAWVDAGRSVGEEVIREMHAKFLAGRVLPLPDPAVTDRALEQAALYVAKPGTPRAVMVDLDGTLCLHNGRSPYDESRVGEDLPNPAVVAAVQALRGAGYRIVCCSGRSEGCREDTERWLGLNVGLVRDGDGTEWIWDALLMRAAGDTRKDSVVKRELFDAHIRDVFDVAFVLDDRQQVVDAWREIGLTVFQVAPGDF